MDLTPDDPRAKEAIIGLIGSTFAQLKEIDKNVVGSSNNIRALKTDVKDLLTQVIQNKSIPSTSGELNVSPTFVAPLAPTHTVVAAGINVPASQQPAPVVEDSNQLVFDFNKKITPDTINDKLDRILDKLNRILELSKT